MKKRGNKIQVLLTDEELKLLDETANERGLTRSALLRTLLLDAVKRGGGGGQTTTPPQEIIVH